MTPEERVIVGIEAHGVMHEQSVVVVATNGKLSHDPFATRVLNRKLHYRQTESVAELFRFLQEILASSYAGWRLRRVTSPQDLAREMEQESIRILEAGLREKRYVPMNDDEVAGLRDDYDRARGTR